MMVSMSIFRGVSPISGCSMNLSPRHLLCSLEVSTEILTSEPNIIVPDHPSIHLTVPGLFKGCQMDGKGRP